MKLKRDDDGEENGNEGEEEYENFWIGSLWNNWRKKLLDNLHMRMRQEWYLCTYKNSIIIQRIFKMEQVVIMKHTALLHLNIIIILILLLWFPYTAILNYFQKIN
jgi:hypothetical protein